MNPVGPLPRLILGAGALSKVGDELALLGVSRALVLSDRGLERSGVVAAAAAALPKSAVFYLDVPENPTVAGADAAYAVYKRRAAMAWWPWAAARSSIRRSSWPRSRRVV